MQAIEGPNGSTIIGQRNRKCLAVLDRELKKGKKRIGVFYGAGHMRDLEHRLGTLGFAPRRTWWLRAIDVDLAAGEHKQAEFLAKNALGQVPVLEDGAAVIRLQDRSISLIAVGSQ